MEIKVNEEIFDVNLIIFDSVSFQAWDSEDGRMVLNIEASMIKSLKVESNE